MTTVRVRVPASTSNLGGGFDCVGIAVERWLRVDARLADGGTTSVELARGGTLSAVKCPPVDDLIYRGFVAACEVAGRGVPRGLLLDAESDIPVGRGIGSSAAALLAGAAAANALLGLGLADEAIAHLCGDIEGHSDNVGPSLLGGAVFATRGADDSTLLSPIDVHPSLRLVFAVPDFPVDTHLARASLPETISHIDARRAAAASAALVLGLASRDARLLAVGLEGPLHIPYRRPLVPGYDDVVAAARALGALGATLSGSGSAIVALVDRSRVRPVAEAMTAAWGARGVGSISFVSPPCPEGLQVQHHPEADSSSSAASAEHADAAHISNNEVTT